MRALTSAASSAAAREQANRQAHGKVNEAAGPKAGQRADRRQGAAGPRLGNETNWSSARNEALRTIMSVGQPMLLRVSTAQRQSSCARRVEATAGWLAKARLPRSGRDRFGWCPNGS